jgi:hypothetical protein
MITPLARRVKAPVFGDASFFEAAENIEHHMQ